ncbi:zeta toxin family protein [Sphaerisporangium sp. TRM90804]|uniref:zeta toxin family protein n=1 Tax=Sphaerisporangium sp. TRM90804 TaxID=3031113 RepID=UPI002449C67A|nr:zeta toxin family protein [Sphaerisporangium sp. TRM90804]MDH2426439.1 zeta toxin family protein [Sphaerisporangium sp. TRM90804]
MGDLFFEGVHRAATPTAVLLAGVPGTSLTAARTELRDRFSTKSGAAFFDINGLRDLHPGYAQLQQRGQHRSAAEKVHGEVTYLWRKAHHAARQAGCNVVAEGALRDSDAVEQLLRDYRQAGYRVEVAIVAAHPSRTWLACLRRYELEKQHYGVGKYTEPSVHAAAVRNMPGIAEVIEREGLADRVSVLRQDGTTVYSSIPAREAGQVTGGSRGHRSRAQPGLDTRRDSVLRLLHATTAGDDRDQVGG